MTRPRRVRTHGPWALVTAAADTARRAALDAAEAWDARRSTATALAARADAALAAYHDARATAAEAEPEAPGWTAVHELRAAACAALAAAPDRAVAAAAEARRLVEASPMPEAATLWLRSAHARAAVMATDAARRADVRVSTAAVGGVPSPAHALALAAAQAADEVVRRAQTAARAAWAVVAAMGEVGAGGAP